jgi:uncharacterized protein YndB with AHSA1/START domain
LGRGVEGPGIELPAQQKEIVVRNYLGLFTCLVLCAAAPPVFTADTPAAKDKPALDPVMVKLADLIGGVWVNSDPKFVVENRFHWAFDNKVIRGHATLGKGNAGEKQGEAYIGWDPAAKNVYYLDCHGGDEVYKGTIKLDGDELVYDFVNVVGPPGKYRNSMKFTSKDEYQFTIFLDQKGKLTPVVRIAMHRQKDADPHRLVTEAVIDAPREQVWKAFATKEGQESWNVAHAEIDCRVGGKMLTHYGAQGKIGDPNTIENIILALDPGHMMTIQVGKPPAQFPYKDAIKNVSTVIYLEEMGSKQTRVRLVGIGYGADEESQKLRGFFDKGNTYTLQKLQEKMTGKTGTLPAKPH